MQFIDDAEFQIAIDDDNGARITSLKWRENEFAVPFRGQVHTSGWYSMAPWAGRIKEGLITNSAGQQIQLPATIDPPHALHGFGLISSWQEIGPGRSLLHLPSPYGDGRCKSERPGPISCHDELKPKPCSACGGSIVAGS